jgi:hypothetical protein
MRTAFYNTPRRPANSPPHVADGRILTLPPHGTGWRRPRRRSETIPYGDEDIAAPNGVHLDTAPTWNGVATSSSPFQSHSQGDEDIAAPKQDFKLQT